jgi:hypothetical protein
VRQVVESTWEQHLTQTSRRVQAMRHVCADRHTNRVFNCTAHCNLYMAIGMQSKHYIATERPAKMTWAQGTAETHLPNLTHCQVASNSRHRAASTQHTSCLLMGSAQLG